MNFNHSWNGNRGRNRGNRGPGRNWRGGHYRGGSHFHRAGPSLLNSDNYYSPNRFRGHDNFPNYYAHSPVNQNEHWTSRNRSLLPNPRQSFLPNMHFSQQNPTRSSSPLPGSEEYMERNISEKSALLKRELELEGSGFITDTNMKQVDSINSDSTNNNFFDNTYPKECNDEQGTLSLNEVTESPRRGSSSSSKKQRPISQSVEEIHQKIINHISNLSYSKKMNLVNLSGPSGYDIAIQEVTRQKRMELSKVLRDMCHNKFKENDDSSQVINAIIPDFDIKIEELPREVVEQLSSTLHEDVTERVSMCIDPELMFQQAAEMLNTTLDSDKSAEEGDDKLDFSCVNFSNNDQICDVPIANNIENKEPTIDSMINESVSAPNVENVDNCPPPTCTVEFTVPPQVVATPPPSTLETKYPNLQEPVVVNSTKPVEEQLYSPGHESSNCSSLDPCNTNYDVMNIPEPIEPCPADIPIPPSTDIPVPPTDPSENHAVDSLNAEDAQNELDVLDLNNRDKISFNLNKRTLLKNDDFTENGSVKDDEEKSQVSITESHNEEKVDETPKVTENESGKEDIAQTVNKGKDQSKNKETKLKEIKDEKKIEKEESPPKKIRKDRKSKVKTKEEDEESEKKKQERKSKSRHESEDSQRTLERDDRSERRQRDKYNVAETSRASHDDDIVERRKDKKVKNKYDGEYYSSKYERGKFQEVYQGQGYDEGYRKRYRESPAVDDDKHRRCSDHDKGFERYRELEADIYHYSKYPVEIEDGRNSKRYYHEKSSYRQEYEYPYNKYDYPASEYYQRSQEVYPSEEYDQKLHYSKAHKSKYKRHNKKHKRHRDRSSDSNASSSGSEKNSSTSSFMVNKHTSKQSDLCESSEEGVTNRLPKTSLMERLQVLCETKLGGIKLEPVSPNPNEDAHKRDSVHSEGDKSINKDINELPKDANLNEQTLPIDTEPIERSGEASVTEKDNASNTAIESVSPITKNRSESEDDLKNSSEVENFESKNYRQRPWKSPGEKKFMMEHLNQNPTNEDGVEIDIECTHDTPLTEGLITNDSTSTVEHVESQPSEIGEPQTNATLSAEVDCGVESQKLDETVLQVDNVASKVTSTDNEVFPVRPSEELKIVEKMLVTTYTQTMSDNIEESTKVREEEVEKKEVTTAFTQTTITNSTTSTQTEMAKMSDTAKQIQTDHVIIVDHLAETTQMDGNIPKPLKCKQFIERMYEIDKEIDRLVKLRQSFYHLFLNVSDTDLVVSESKGTVSSSKSVQKQFESKGSRRTPTPSISERGNSKKRNSHTSGDHKTARSSDHSSRSSHHKHDVTDSKTSTPEPSKQKSTQPHKERSRKTDPKPVNVADKQKSSKSIETQKVEKRESEGVNKNTTPISDGAPPKVQHHGRGRPRKNPPNTSQTGIKLKPPKEEPEEKKQKATNVKERSDTSRKRKLKKDETPDKDVKRLKKSDPIESGTVEKEKVVEVIPVAVELEKEANDEKETNTEKEETNTEKEETNTEKEETKPEDSAEDCTPVKVVLMEVPPQEEKDVTVVDESESVPEPGQKLEVENKLNGSFVEDTPKEKEELKVDPVIVVRPATPVTEESIPILMSSESLTPLPKKKKRRLSGMMAEYRKKKKKSKKSKKRDEKSAEPKRVSVESSVKITRFSLEQLENMRESIRGKQSAEEEDSPICDDNQVQDIKLKETQEGSETVETVGENVSESKPVLQGESESISYSIDFKNFIGAILVIKVIEDTVLAASDKGQLFCFNILNGELLNTVDISNLAVTSLVVTSNNDVSTVYVGSLDAQLTIFNFQTKEIVKQESVSEPIQCMEYSWNYVFVGSDRGTLLRFDLDTETVVDQTKISSFNILMMKASLEGPRKILVVATRNSPVSIRDALSGLLLRTMETSFSPTVYTLLIDRSMVYCGTSQHGILVYTFEDGQLALQHEATKSKGVVCMQIVSNLLFAGCYNGNIYVYNTKTNAYLGTMSGPGGLMLSMEIVNDKIIVGTKSSNFKAWRIPQKYYEEK